MTIFTAKNILEAYNLARKSRKNKQEVYMFDQNLEERLNKMLGFVALVIFSVLVFSDKYC